MSDLDLDALEREYRGYVQQQNFISDRVVLDLIQRLREAEAETARKDNRVQVNEARIGALERVREIAKIYVSMRKATIETEADSGLLSDRLYELEDSQLNELDVALASLETEKP